MPEEVSPSSALPISARRRAWMVLAFFIATLPIVLVGVRGALLSNTNDPRQWLPRGFEETALYEEFKQNFGRDELSIVTWPGCTLGNPRVERLAEALVSPPGEDQPGWFDRVVTASGIIAQLTSPPLELSRAEAIRRLEGILIGTNGRTTCLLVTLSEFGEDDRVGAVEEIRRVAQEECGLAPDELRLAGPTVDAATIDIESQRLLLELAALSALVAFLVTWQRLGDIGLTGIIFAAAIYSTGLALSILYYSGGHMNLLLTMLPPLVYVLMISAAVHLVNYYRDAIAAGHLADAPRLAIVNGWAPCLLAALTTAIGLLSLATSRITPIRHFGFYAAIGMALSLVVLLFFLPAALTVWRSPSARPRGKKPAEADRWSWLADGVIALVSRFHVAIAAASVATMILLGWGLWSLKSTVKLQHRFASESRIIEDYRWMEEHLGPLVPLEVIVRFDSDCPLDPLQRMMVVDNLQRQIAEMEAVGATMSAATFFSKLPRGRTVRHTASRHILARRLQQHRSQFIDAHFLADAPGEELWRISVRVDALGDLDYAHFTDTLSRHVTPTLAAIPGARVTFTGVIPMIYKAQRQLFTDLVRSFFLAFGVIAVVMIVVLRSVPAGLLAMAPNLFPAVVIFGFMGWQGILIEIGSVMTASAALGIAVDDTFHFLTWFRRGTRQGMSRPDALRFAFGRCAQAMMHTTIICSCGLIVFSISSFMPIVHFAWMMVALLGAAIVGDLVFLPAVLAGPLGRVFEDS